MSAADLPMSTAQARNEGLSSYEIKNVLDIMSAKKVPAHEARDIIDEERTARRENGPVENFGAFVQSRLDAGLRGRDLAAAIRSEHQARGKGKGKAMGKDKDEGMREPGAVKGRPDDRREAGEEKGQKGEHQGGKPETKGKPKDDNPAGRRPDRPNR